jgi:hypothetical protein
MLSVGAGIGLLTIIAYKLNYFDGLLRLVKVCILISLNLKSDFTNCGKLFQILTKIYF